MGAEMIGVQIESAAGGRISLNTNTSTRFISMFKLHRWQTDVNA